MRESKRSPKPPPSKEIDDGRPARKASPSRKKSRRRSAAAAAPDDGIPDDEVDIVVRVARMMKANKLSQVQVGQEARVSQAVISQWLARKSVANPPAARSRPAGAHERSAPQVPRAQRQGGQGHGGLAGGAAQRHPGPHTAPRTRHTRPPIRSRADWRFRRQNSLVAPLTKESTTSVLRPSHHKAPIKRKAEALASKAQIQDQIQESATGLTFKESDEDEEEEGEGGKARRKRKRPPQLTAALGDERGPRSSRRTRGDGRIFSPSEFAPVNALGQLEVSAAPSALALLQSVLRTNNRTDCWVRLQTPVGMPTPGNTPWGEAPGPFWESHKREPTPREAQGAVERPSVRGGMEPGSTRSRDRPLIDVDSLLPPSPAGARRSPRISPRVRPNSSVVWKILCPTRFPIFGF